MRKILTPLMHVEVLAVMVLAMLALASCNTISSIIHDDQVVARVGEHKLYRSELESVVPAFASPEDSAAYASKYIDGWATDILYAEMAESQLSKEELDVSEQLEDYRRSLLRYRYERRYVSDRLDTLVTDSQIQEYYDAHQSSFILERPILKVRFVDIMKDSPDRDEIIRLMSSSDYSKVEKAAAMAGQSALRYFDLSDTWTDALVLAKEFGTDYATMLSNLKGSVIRMESEERGDVLYAYVAEIRQSGVAPLDYCSGNIRNLILSARKHALVSGLEQDLLKEAREHNDFVIYE